MATEVAHLSARELSTAYRSGALSPVEVIDALGSRIEEIDPVINAFAQLCLDRARSDAERCTDEIARGGQLGPLHGIPVAVKELLDVEGVVTTYGSGLFDGHVPTADAAAVERLRLQGAVVVGTTRSHEFGWGITSQHPTRGGPRNPRNLGYVPGGSSGGSAAAVAAGLVPIALGTDTGGSIRLPAAVCGVTGLKPSFGAVSTRGVMTLSMSLDHVGCLARDERDALTCLDAISGHGHHLADTSITSTTGAAGSTSRRSPVVACPTDSELAGLDDDHRAALDQLLGVLSNAGVQLVQRSINGEAARTAFGPIQLIEAYVQHACRLGMYPGRREMYGSDVLARLELASTVTIADYIIAVQRRTEYTNRMEAELVRFDAWLTPVAGGSPSRIDEPDVAALHGRAIDFRDLVLPHTTSQNLTGLPAVTVHIGTDRNGIPIAVQLTGRRWGERALAALAADTSHLLASTGVTRPQIALP